MKNGKTRVKPVACTLCSLPAASSLDYNVHPDDDNDEVGHHTSADDDVDSNQINDGDDKDYGDGDGNFVGFSVGAGACIDRNVVSDGNGDGDLVQYSSIAIRLT